MDLHSAGVQTPTDPSEANGVWAVPVHSVRDSRRRRHLSNVCALNDHRADCHCSVILSTQSSYALELSHCCWSTSLL